MSESIVDSRNTAKPDVPKSDCKSTDIMTGRSGVYNDIVLDRLFLLLGIVLMIIAWVYVSVNTSKVVSSIGIILWTLYT